MKILKKIVSFSLIMLLVIGITFNVASANENTVSLTDEINIDDVLSNPENYPTIKIRKLESNEYIDILINDKNIDEATREKLINEAMITPYGSFTTYYELQQDVTVTSSYHCYPYFYCKMLMYSGNPTPDRILSIEYANINRQYGNTSKQFSGSLYYNLEAGNQFYWDLNGDFYNNGTTTYSYGGSVGVNGAASTSFSVAYASNHYAYKQISGRYKSAAMHP